jgi:hypothetical protein
VAIALVALAASLFFHSPRVWALAEPLPESTYWARGLQFIEQARDPLGATLTDAGLVWRLAPALAAHWLGLRGTGALLVPWIGLAAMLVQCAQIALQRTRDKRFAMHVTLLVATTSATLAVTGWLGINDAWYAVALLAVAFHPGAAGIVAACLVGPWIDERFVLALPLAMAVRHAGPGGASHLKLTMAAGAIGVGIYCGLRLTNVIGVNEAPMQGYWDTIRHEVHRWLPWAPLGWFMGLRAAWLPVVFLFVRAREHSSRDALLMGGAAAAALGSITLLAADASRATTLLLPLVLLGALQFREVHGEAKARQAGTWVVIANLAMPAMHVTYRSADLINMLPVELARWWMR